MTTEAETAETTVTIAFIKNAITTAINYGLVSETSLLSGVVDSMLREGLPNNEIDRLVSLVDQMVKTGEIARFEYTTPHKNRPKAFYLPAGSVITQST